MKTAQLMIKTGGNMRKVIKKSPTKKRSSETENKPIAAELSANQRRFLQILVEGIEGEPSLLAGRP
ncbi:hypothetical protein JFU49_08565 [Pseudomonas sp. TH03]|uniref:hypothetical protein n=1 Tax=Pseudomonas sp. TH03 TaxID=2796369 RepID=UPI001911429A|nr:hypothetical protein [Pseudomonas sp. TH03]MBK5550324.1 hypothetical protein [Pseudomonas sp. TH03]